MQLCELSIKQINISGDNPRIINKKDPEFLELIESVRALGVQMPIGVREIGKEFQLLYGERRLLASIEAGRGKILAINRGQMNDDEAFKLTFIENAHRENLTPLEQGKAAGIAMEKCKGDIEAAMSMLGKPEHWIRQRAAIHNNLSEKWKKLVLEEDKYQHFTAAHLGLIARFPQHIQDGNIVRSLQFSHKITVKELEKKLAEELRLLKKAPFDTSKCINCTKRSSAQPTLWSTEPETVTGAGDKCLDAKCWQKKQAEKMKSDFIKLQEEHPNLAVIMTDQPYQGEDRLFKRAYGKVLSQYDFDQVKKTEKGAKPAFVVFGKGKGKIIYIKKRSSSSDSGRADKPKTLKQLKAELEENRWQTTLRKMHLRISKMQPDKINHHDKLFAFIALSISLGIDVSTAGDSLYFLNKVFGLYRKNKKRGLSFIIGHIWRSILNAFQNSYWSGTPDEVKLGREIATLFDINLDGIYEDVCKLDEFKEPAEWANLKADGSPKKDKKTKSEKANKVRKCRICGCTEETPCQTPEGPCHWVEGHGDLCSGCVGKHTPKKAKKATKAKKSKSKGK